ncbi:gastrokine-1-like [Chlamydotis macqueenii]
MKLTIVTTVLLGLLLTPALAQYFQNTEGSQQFNVAGGYQILNINRQWRVAVIEQQSNRGTWKTIWNYNRGYVASRVPEGVCFISIMNRNLLPAFDALPRLAEEIRGLKGEGQPAREITYVVMNTPVRDLQAYGQDIFAMCRGVTTFMAYQVNRPQFTYNEGSCVRLDVLQLVELKYCRGNNNNFNNNFNNFGPVKQDFNNY